MRALARVPHLLSVQRCVRSFSCLLSSPLPERPRRPARTGRHWGKCGAPRHPPRQPVKHASASLGQPRAALSGLLWEMGWPTVVSSQSPPENSEHVFCKEGGTAPWGATSPDNQRPLAPPSLPILLSCLRKLLQYIIWYLHLWWVFSGLLPVSQIVRPGEAAGPPSFPEPLGLGAGFTTGSIYTLAAASQALHCEDSPGL